MPELSTVTWPASFGSPMVDGYGISSAIRVEGFSISDGEDAFRLDRSSGPQIATLSFLMDATMFRNFESWWYWEIRKGLLWFMLPLRTGNELTIYDVHMLRGYKADFILGENGWQLTFDVEYIYSRTRGNEPIPPVFPQPRYLLLEDLSYFLDENGARILLEERTF